MVVEQIWLQKGRGADESTSTLGHEVFVHGFPDQNRLRELRQSLNDGTIKPGTKAYEQKLDLITNSEYIDHKNLSEGKSKAYINFVQQLDAVKSTTKFTKAYQSDVKDHK